MRAALVSLVAVANTLLAGVVAGIFWRVPETDDLGAQPAIYWTDARLAFDPQPDTGPVLVIVHYTVTPERQAVSWRRWGISAGLDSGLGGHAGSCTATESDRTNSSRSSAFRLGRSTCASTPAA